MKTIEEMVTDLAPFQQRRMARCALAGATFTFKPGVDKALIYQSSKWVGEFYVGDSFALPDLPPTDRRVIEPTLGRCVERMWHWMLKRRLVDD